MIEQEILKDAKQEFEDLRRVADGGEGHKKNEEVAVAAKRAAEYLSGGFDTLKEMGLALMAAVFASLDRSKLRLTQKGKALLNQLHQQKDETNESSLGWDELEAEVVVGPEMQRIISEAVAVGEEWILVEALCLSNQLTDMSVQPVPEEKEKSKTTSLVKQTARLILLDSANPAEAANRLLALSKEQRVLAIGSAYGQAMDGAPKARASLWAEKQGRRLEKVLDEMPDKEEAETIRSLIQAGETDAVLSMLRGRAGEISTVAPFLSEELISELFEKDADLNDDDESFFNSRLITITWTLVMEAKSKTAIRYLFFHEEGKKWWDMLVGLAGAGDEDAQQIIKGVEELSAEEDVSSEVVAT